MRALVVYESMFGSTRAIAESVAEGLSERIDTRVVAAHEVGPEDLADIDLLVVGAPTHAHGMPRASTRTGAPSYVDRSGGQLHLEKDADTDSGVRELLDALAPLPIDGAAFDTRVDMAPVLSGRASRGIAKALSGHAVALAVPPESFLVDKHTELLSGEVDRALAWGSLIGTSMAEGHKLLS